MKVKQILFLIILFSSVIAHKRDLKLDTLSSLSKLNQRYLSNFTKNDFASTEEEDDYIDENDDITSTTTTTTTPRTTTASYEEHDDNLEDTTKNDSLYDDEETSNSNNEYEETDNEDDLDEENTQVNPYNCPSQCRCKFNKLESKTSTKIDENEEENEYEDEQQHNDEIQKRDLSYEDTEQDTSTNNDKYRIEIDCSNSNINTIRNLLEDEFPLDQIVKLNLSNNRFKMLKLDEGFEDLINLEELDLSGNKLLRSLSARSFLKKFRHLKNIRLTSLPQINCDSNDYLKIDCKWFKTLIYLHKRNISVDLTNCNINQLSQQSVSIVSHCFGGGGSTNQKKSSNIFQIDNILFELLIQPELDQILIEGDTLELDCRLRKQFQSSNRKSTDLTNRIFLKTHLKWYSITNDLETNELTASRFNILETHHRFRKDLVIESKLLIKNVKSSQHSGKFYCTTSNQFNSKLTSLNTSNVEITILNKNNDFLMNDLNQNSKFKNYCPETITTTYKGKYKWKKTLANTKLKQKCLFNNRDTYYSCDGQGRWAAVPNLEDCSFESNLTRYLQHLTKLDSKSLLQLNSNISLDDLIHKLVVFQSADINPYDIIYIQRFLIANYQKTKSQQRQLIWLNDLLSKLTVLKQAKQFDPVTFSNYFHQSLIPNLVSKLNESSSPNLNGTDLGLASNYLASVLIASQMLRQPNRTLRENEHLVCYLEKYSLTQQIYFRCYLTDQFNLKPYTTHLELTHQTTQAFFNTSELASVFILFENNNMFPTQFNSTSSNYTDLNKQNRLINYDLNENENDLNNETCSQIFAFSSLKNIQMNSLNVSIEIKMPSKYYRLLTKIETKLINKQQDLKSNSTVQLNVKLFETDKNPFDQIFSQIEYQIVNSISNQNLTQDELDDLELNDTLKLNHFKDNLINRWFNIQSYEIVYFNSSRSNCTILSVGQNFKLEPNLVNKENNYKLYAKLVCRLDSSINEIQYFALKNRYKKHIDKVFSSEIVSMIDQYMKTYNLNDISLFNSFYSMLNSQYRWFKHKIIYFSCVCSFFMLITTLVMYIISRKTILMPRSFYHVLINIWLSISLLILTFVISINQINIAYLCFPSSIALHYLSLCSSVWYTLYFYSLFAKLNTLKKTNYNLIFNLTIDKKGVLYNTLAKKQTTKSDDEDDEEDEEEFIEKPVIHLYMLGYGLPMLLCSIIISISKRDYLSVPFSSCFTNETNILIGSLVVPLLIMIFIKLVFVCLTFFTLRQIINDLKKDSNNLNELNLNKTSQQTNENDQVHKLEMCKKWAETTNDKSTYSTNIALTEQLDQRTTDLLNESKSKISLAARSNTYSDRTSVMDTQHKPNVQLKFAFISLLIYLVSWSMGACLTLSPYFVKKYNKSFAWYDFTPEELQLNDLLKRIFSYLFACFIFAYSLMQISFYLLSRDDVFVYQDLSNNLTRKRAKLNLFEKCFIFRRLSKMFKDADTLTIEDIRKNVKNIEKGVQTNEIHYLMKVIEKLYSTRRSLNDSVLKKVINYYYITYHVQNDKDFLLNFINDIRVSTPSVALMEPDDSIKTEPKDSNQLSSDNSLPVIESAAAPATTVTSSTRTYMPSMLPEVDLYLHLLVLLFAIDHQKHKQALELAEKMMIKIANQDRRSLDVIASKCYFYYSRIHELTERLDQIRTTLYDRLRIAIMRNDIESTAVLINLLLRGYLQFNLYDQAINLLSKYFFPPSASNNEWARYLFYNGRIKAMQLEYSEAHKSLVEAIQKAPKDEAIGFKQIAQKFAIVVQLLLGEIPDKKTFCDPQLRKALYPYFQLTQAVHAGNPTHYNEVIEKFGQKFIKDKTWCLIIRLKNIGTRTDSHIASLSYSKVSLDNTTQKLHIDSSVDVEFMVSKAIRDGVIEEEVLETAEDDLECAKEMLNDDDDYEDDCF